MLVARSSLECHLYMQLHGCVCGSPASALPHRLVYRDERLCAAYSGTCGQCARPLEFEFALAGDIVPATQFGGAEPSQIIDAGQYLETADLAAAEVPADVTGLTTLQRERALHSLRRAISAVEEVLKFLPPGADSAPESAFFTRPGRARLDREPGRFHRARLHALLEAYQRSLQASAARRPRSGSRRARR